MQKWEYCALVGLAKKGCQPDPYYPALWSFTPEGCKVAEMRTPQKDSVACTIAQLGDDGWEMVGWVDLRERTPLGGNPMTIGTGAILFKRSKPDA